MLFTRWGYSWSISFLGVEVPSRGDRYVQGMAMSWRGWVCLGAGHIQGNAVDTYPTPPPTILLPPLPLGPVQNPFDFLPWCWNWHWWPVWMSQIFLPKTNTSIYAGVKSDAWCGSHLNVPLMFSLNSANSVTQNIIFEKYYSNILSYI